MKKFSYFYNGATVNFAVNETWLDNLKIKASGDVSKQVFDAAVSDPAESAIETDSDSLNADLKEITAMVEKAKEINRSTDGAADVRVSLGSAPGKFNVSVGGNIRNEDVGIAEATKALNSVDAFLKHTNLVKVGVAVRGARKTRQLVAEELEIFINNGMKRGDIRKVVSIIPTGDDLLIIYISKKVFRGMIAACCCDDEDDEE